MDEALITHHQRIDQLTRYLNARREAILSNWRTACEADTAMHSASALSREEFNDQVPTILNILGQHLLGKTPLTDTMSVATEHGLHRWHKGYPLQELLKETDHLRAGLITELGTYWDQYPQIPNQVMQHAYQVTGQLIGQVVQGSVLKYDELQALAATGRAQSLQEALEKLNQLDSKRNELLRMTSHDLRSGLGIVEGAAQLMNQPDNTEAQRQQMLSMMQRNLSSVRDLIGNLSELARLEAGQEPIEIQSFDAAELLRSIVDSGQPLAKERGLSLMADGPDHLPVESDRIKVQRLVQNLLFNALRYTKSGWVSVSWSAESEYRWTISVQDSGPGLPTAPSLLLATYLAPTTESTAVYEKNKETEEPAQAVTNGEGLGLHIVKKLCEVLRATLDIESKADVGTLFRIRLLKHWE